MAKYEVAIMRLDGGMMSDERVGADDLDELEVALRSIGSTLTNEVLANGCTQKEMLMPVIEQHDKLDNLRHAEHRMAFVSGSTVRVFSTTDAGVAYVVFIAFGPADYVDAVVTKFNKYN